MNAVPKILIVEDEPDLRNVYTDALGGEGYQLDTAVDGDEAVQKILQGGWDLILLDIVMPKKNGFDVLETVRRTIIDPMQKQQLMDSIIFMTNLDNMADLTHALSLGPKEYVVKTQVTPGQVQELVRSFLDKKTSHPSVQSQSDPSVPQSQVAPTPSFSAAPSSQPTSAATFTLPAAPIQPDVPSVIQQSSSVQQPNPSTPEQSSPAATQSVSQSFSPQIAPMQSQQTNSSVENMPDSTVSEEVHNATNQNN